MHPIDDEDTLLPNRHLAPAQLQSDTLRWAIAAMYEPNDSLDAKAPPQEWRRWVQLRRQATTLLLHPEESSD